MLDDERPSGKNGPSKDGETPAENNRYQAMFKAAREKGMNRKGKKHVVPVASTQGGRAAGEEMINQLLDQIKDDEDSLQGMRDAYDEIEDVEYKKNIIELFDHYVNTTEGSLGSRLFGENQDENLDLGDEIDFIKGSSNSMDAENLVFLLAELGLVQ